MPYKIKSHLSEAEMCFINVEFKNRKIFSKPETDLEVIVNIKRYTSKIDRVLEFGQLLLG
jgi:hypothetical protein